MVDRLSTENNELKKSQRAALEAQKALLKANQELAAQMSQVQSQLATVKDDIRQEFDEKLRNMLQMLNLVHPLGLPSTSDPQSTPPRQAKMKAKDNPVTPTVKKKLDTKSTPMMTNPFAIDNPNRDRNMYQYLLRKFDEEHGQMAPVTPAIPTTGMHQDPKILPEARADPGDNVG